ncbi:heavy metal translocating P-type ATPase [Streptococcus sp. SG1]|jgi:cadmium-exporting ATPase|uniref:Cd(2+)-exporting ATPase n=2 Tax=Streptococcus mitis TaxID=28037 RepID=F9HLN3_STRMT|nr:MULTISPECIES: heavy metal translocating P-type ATPase [Streptococcus]MDU2685649.1 heavy metal translocating P-type ATPase [Streptococcus parasanguinis]VRK11977.1 heavy metal-transporting E1-E2 ATPase [Streptococcus pneumoniae]ARC47499.1 cadmium-translocating P-type ATPase [Streptococcus gordonii]EFN99016.1 cadmium-translocating P-type ATPase [Streptococcus mitis SK564]EGP69429.1 cadmium-exporting ATPase [Streptococcus mitis SK1080]
MKKEYVLRGIDCGNCAAKIERAVNQLEQVESATVNLIAQKLTLETKSEDGIDKEIIDLVDAIEPGIEVISEKKEEALPEKRDWAKELLLAVTILFAFGFFLPEEYFWIRLVYYLTLYIIIGHKVLIKMVQNIQRGNIFDENFLMSIATLGAFLLGEFPEAVAVMLFYQIGEYFQDKATSQSRQSIAQLMDIRSVKAWRLEGGEAVQVDPETVRVADHILVKPGEKVPLDGLVRKGRSILDTSALTGESLPREIGVGEDITSGVINLTSPLVIEVRKTFSQSTVNKILELVENASNKKAETERMITRFSRVYTPVVVGIAFLLASLPPLLGLGEWSTWLYRALTFLVISCPCALAVSVPMSFFGGLGGASKLGVLVKGGNYLEALAKLDTVVFDKTGTITKGIFAVDTVVNAEGIEDNILYLAAHLESYSNHPIANSIRTAYGQEVDENRVSQITELPGQGMSGRIDGRQLYLGNARLMEVQGIAYPAIDSTGTVLYLAEDSHFLGYFLITDQVKETSIEALKDLQAVGIKKTVLLSGDRQAVVDEFAQQFAFNDAFGDCLPQDKVSTFEEILTQSQQAVAFVGDGVNDAPVLARADVGIAMGGLGSDAAIESADVVLMDDDLGKLPQVIRLAKKTVRIARQNMTLAIVVKLIFLVLSGLGISNMWEAIFADVGVTLLAVWNALRTLRIDTSTLSK